METKKKTIGIIGGMGPMATADLFRKITAMTNAVKDSEHIHVIIDSNGAIPDRTAAILGKGEDPRTVMTATIKRLEQAGADILLMPCNTAHFFYDDLQAATACPILHMLKLTAEEIKGRGLKNVCLLATDGTVQTGIYSKLFEQNGIGYMLPEPEEQKLVMDAIYNGVKAGNAAYDATALKAALAAMRARGAEAFVLGCTELPIAFADYRLDYPTVDPTTVLAKAAIVAAGYELKK